MDRISELEAQVSTFQRRCESLEIEAAQANRAAERATVESHLRAAAIEVGVVPGALDDLVNRALQGGQWKLDSRGKLLRQQDGQPDVDIHGDYVTPKIWLKSLKSEAPYYFADYEENAAKSKDDAANPWSRECWNLTNQGRIAAASLDEAQRLAKAAGSHLGATQPPAPRA